MKTGIYCIKNKINGKCYIGSTSISFNKRKLSHFNKLKLGKHINFHLQNAYNKYGQEVFSFEILEEVKPEECIIKEQWYLDNYKPEYNICKIAGSCLGVKHSDKTKLKNSIAQTGKIISREIKEKMSISHLGKIQTTETKQKISKSTKNKLPVKQIDMCTGEIIKIWDSIKEAAINLFPNKIILTSQISAISLVCKNKKNFKSAFGFKWQYNI